MSTENPQTTKKCPSCQADISLNITKCPYCGKDFKSWLGQHPLLALLLIFLGFPFVMLTISPLFVVGGGSNPSSSTKVEQSAEVIDKKYLSPSSQEVANNILVEQKARADETQNEVIALMGLEKYQEAKDLLLKRQKKIIAVMSEIRTNENLLSSDKDRVLKPLVVESESRANQVRVIAEYLQEKLLAQ